MPLDSIVKGFLDQMKALGGPTLAQAGPVAGREQFIALMQLVGPKDVPVGKTQNIAVPGPAGPIAIRVYTPVAAGGEAMPALVYFHGGGFVIGGIETHDGLCRVMANEGGLRVISVEYRLAPEHKYPAALDDAFAALKWVAGNAAEIGVDANRIAVGGDSAGGNLAAVVAQLAKTEGAPKIVFQLLIYPVTQLAADAQTRSMRENAKGYFLEKESMDWFTKLYCPDARHRADARLSPLLCADLAGLPPAYVVTAGFDPLRDEGKAYADKLDAAGVAVTYVNYPGMVHGFFSMRSLIPKAREAVAAAAAAVGEGVAQ